MLKMMKREYTLQIEIDRDTIDDIYEFLPKMIRLYQKKYTIQLQYNIEEINENFKLKEIEEVVKAINIKDLKSRYSYIYDTLCNKLDKEMEQNYCKFKDNICVNYELKNPCHENGCCNGKNRGTCKYLIDSKCTLNCISCKLFTCKHLRKRGIVHNLNNYVLSNFFTPRQRNILRLSFWTSKEDIMKELLKYNRKYR